MAETKGQIPFFISIRAAQALGRHSPALIMKACSNDELEKGETFGAKSQQDWVVAKISSAQPKAFGTHLCALTGNWRLPSETAAVKSLHLPMVGGLVSPHGVVPLKNSCCRCSKLVPVAVLSSQFKQPL